MTSFDTLPMLELGLIQWQRRGSLVVKLMVPAASRYKHSSKTREGVNGHFSWT